MLTIKCNHHNMVRGDRLKLDGIHFEKTPEGMGKGPYLIKVGDETTSHSFLRVDEVHDQNMVSVTAGKDKAFFVFSAFQSENDPHEITKFLSRVSMTDSHASKLKSGQLWKVRQIKRVSVDPTSNKVVITCDNHGFSRSADLKVRFKIPKVEHNFLENIEDRKLRELVHVSEKDGAQVEERLLYRPQFRINIVDKNNFELLQQVEDHHQKNDHRDVIGTHGGSKKEETYQVNVGADGVLMKDSESGLLEDAEVELVGSGQSTDAEVLEDVYSAKHAKAWITDMKFAPNRTEEPSAGNRWCTSLAVGSHDRNIYIYSILQVDKDARNSTGFHVWLRSICKGHNSYITHMDFSKDGHWLQSNCGAYELLFWDVRTGKDFKIPNGKFKPKKAKRQPSATAMRDIEWATQTCVLGWPVQGIWPKCADGTDINAVDVCVKTDEHASVIVTADDFGKLKLFRFPCIEKGSSFLKEHGHSSHVTNVRWSFDGKSVVSVGGNDRCVFFWKRAGELHSEDHQELTDAESLGGGITEVDESATELSSDSDDHGMWAGHGDEMGDQSLAIKPWEGQYAHPVPAPPSNPSKPRLQEPELQWVYGYRSQDCRNNAKYNAAGDIIYHTAGVGIVYHHDPDVEDPAVARKQPKQQKFFKGHDDDILCLDVDLQGRYVATGQTKSSRNKKKKPCICVWDAASCRMRCELQDAHQRAVICVAFSSGGDKIASVGADDNHSVALWHSRSGDWKDGKLVSVARGDTSMTLFACFPMSGNSFATGGVGHIRFWKSEGHSLKSSRGIIGSERKKAKGQSKKRKGGRRMFSSLPPGSWISFSQAWRLETSASGAKNVERKILFASRRCPSSTPLVSSATLFIPRR